MTILRAVLGVTLTFEIIGAAVSLLLLVDAKRDLGAVNAGKIANGRRLVARTSVRNEWLRLGTVVALVMASVLMILLLWERPPDTLSGETIGVVFSIDIAAMMLVAQSLSAYAMRKKLFDGYTVEVTRTPPRS